MQEFGCLFLSAPLDPSASDINVKAGTPAGAAVPFHTSFFFPQIKSQNDVVRLQQRYRVVVVVVGGEGWHWGPFSVGDLARPQELGRFISAVSRGSGVFASSLEKVYPHRWGNGSWKSPASGPKNIC